MSNAQIRSWTASQHRVRQIIVATAIIVGVWLITWVLAICLQVRAPLERAEAIVVLSGSSAYGERTSLAASLYHQGRAPLIILTNDNLRGGWSTEEERNLYFVERAATELRNFGVPADRINVLPQPVSSTYDEAVLLRDYALGHGNKALLFVTSPYHSRRALWTLRQVFKGSGVEIGLETIGPGQQSPNSLTWWASVGGWRQVAWEYPKLIYYWIRYA